MKILANENFPAPSVRYLRERGHDVRFVAEDSPGESDAANLRAAHEEGRVILTFDRDYGELVFRHRMPAPAGVVFLRFDPDYPLHAGEVVNALFRDAGVTFAGYFTVVDRDFTARQRPIPETPNA